MAALPLVAIGVVEKIAFNTSHFTTMLGNRLSGGAEGAASPAGSMSMDRADTPHSRPIPSSRNSSVRVTAGGCQNSATRLRPWNRLRETRIETL
jgi:hypothetical protein